MNKKTLAVGAMALAVVFAAAACSDTGTDTDTTVATSPATTSATTTTAADEAAAHNDADVMFAQMMLPHHSQAIEMSDILLDKQDIPADVTALAEQIKAAQGPEIAQLESWLAQWGEPTEMPALSEAQGADAARLFLEQMIAHHEGAVDMAQTEIEDGQFPEAVEMARTIVDTQQQEIETMRELLTTL